MIFSTRGKNIPFYEKKEDIPAAFEKALSISFGFIEKGVSLLMSRSRKLESGFQDDLRKELKELFPGCLIFKMDQIQGIPDLLVLFKNKWATLECKQHVGAKRQPNQEYYVGLMNEMSFSRFICPENKDAVLKDLVRIFKGGN